MVETIVSGLSVTVPELRNPAPFDGNVELTNANPQCGPFPFDQTTIMSEASADGAIFVADVDPAFIKAQILPRGRPHFSLLHIALVDDALAVASFSIIAGQVYGQGSRYVELAAAASFHREAFPEGSIATKQYGTIGVDGFRTRWQLLPRKERTPLLDRGICQVSVLGLRNGEEVPVASVEIEYLRRHAVRNIV